MEINLADLKNSSADIGVLYVEDNPGLRQNMQTFLKKFFEYVSVAPDGEEGYRLFCRLRPKIIITDIIMPKLNGLTMAEKIKKIDPDCNIIIMSGHNDQKYLFKAIEVGIFRYLNKPTQLPLLIKTLHDAVATIHEHENRRIFLNQIQDVFNFQNNLVAMVQDGELILGNQRFMEFFDVEDLDGFKEHFNDLDKILLEHKGFLYSTPESQWYDTAFANPGTLYHTKMIDHTHNTRHLILKLRLIPNKKNLAILSFDDVTELNLMGIFDQKSADKDKALQENKTIFSLLKIVKENNAEVKIHNFYKGLTITNPAVITKINDNQLTLKTANSQLKILQLSQLTIISSEIFPSNVICRSIQAVNIEEQTFILSNMAFARRSATDRQHIRLTPEPNHNCTLIYKKVKFPGDVKIVDISVKAVRIEIDALPAGMETGLTVTLSIVLPRTGQPLIINTPAKVFRIDESVRSYNLVLQYELSHHHDEMLADYLAHRQMALIREFKKLQIMPSGKEQPPCFQI